VNLLLDTHALLWWLAGTERLSRRAWAAIGDPGNQVFVSAASAWEIAIKAALGKLDVPPNLSTWLPDELRANRFAPMPIKVNHALRVEALPRHHSDPFDRMLIAQAQEEDLTLISADSQFDHYDVALLR
jgi:PIN domain nuclease of toxin-antitoxin system